jgi:hypothetical protein
MACFSKIFLPQVCKVTPLNENFPSWPSLADSAYQQWLQITLVLDSELLFMLWHDPALMTSC